MKTNIMRQLEVDMGTSIKSLDSHYFVTGHYNKDMRYWSRCDATLMIVNGALLFRSDNERLTQAVKETYSNVNAEWFGTVSNLKSFEALLQSYGYGITNYAPFYIPSSSFEAYIDNEIEFVDKDDIQQFQGDTRFSECFCFQEQDPDLMGALIRVDGDIVAMAGINQNGLHALEIGINVLENFRGRGYATRLVRAITTRAMDMYPDPMIAYGTQFTHMESINVATRSNFGYAISQIMISRK